jgi:TonB-linked SusC/RagA family outer membrane protein
MKRNLLLCAVFLLSFIFSARAQEKQKSVSGRVVSSSDGTGIPGVNVIIKGTVFGTVTDMDGNYKITFTDEGDVILIFSFVGFVTEEFTIGNRTTIDVELMEDLQQLSEVVVTALGIEREERSLGYAIQEVDGEQLNATKSDNFLNSLSGRVAGVHIKNNTNFGGSTNVIIRGSSSLTGNNQALFVVDGVPISNSNTNNGGQSTGRSGYDYGNAAADINPNDIESITVLKGAAATALYGSRAANGVIMVTTKKGKMREGGGVGVTLNSNVTFGKIDKTTFPKYQNDYGAGYGPYYGHPDYPYLAGIDIDGDGNVDPVVPFTEDASRGQKFDPNLLVYQYNAFVPESKFYGQRTPWVAAKNGPESFFETAVNFTNSVEVSSANENGSFRFSYTNSNNSGIMPNSELIRNSFLLSGSYNIMDNLKLTTSANYIKTDGLARPSTGYSDNILTSFRQWWQMNVDVKEQKDLYFDTRRNVTWNPLSYDDPTPIYWDNLYWVRYENFEEDSRSRLTGFAQVDWEINDFFSVLGRVTIDSYTELQEERKATTSVSGELGVDRPDVTSGYSRFDRTWSETNIDLILNFHKRYGEFDVAAMGGLNIRKNKYDKVFASTNGGLAVPGLYALNNSVDPMLPPEETLSEKGVNGYFGSVNVGYKDMIYLEGTFRNDVSSALPEENWSYFYPSVTGTFVFSEVLDVSWLSLGKLRANYAEVGNDLDPLKVYDTYRGVAPFAGNALATNFPTKNNQELKSERQKSIEFGLGMNFLEDRVGFDFSYYKSSTFDQLIPVRVSQATGYASKWVNAGEIENKGMELVLFATPVKMNGFRWDIMVNWSKNDNEVIELFTDETGNEVTNLQLGSLQGGLSINATVGKPYGTIQGSDYVYHDNGGRLIKPNGRYEISPTNDNVIGNFNPDWFGGVRNEFSYKNFSFSFLIDMQQGGEVFSLDMWYGIGTGLYAETAGLNDLGNPVRDPIVETTPGNYGPDSGGFINKGVMADGSPNTTRVRGDYYAADGWAVSPNSRFTYDASFVKLREVVLTYNFPRSLLKSTPITAASVSFVGSNLWIISKNLPYADPEATQGSGNIQGWQSGVLPTVKNYGFNLSVSF